MDHYSTAVEAVNATNSDSRMALPNVEVGLHIVLFNLPCLGPRHRLAGTVAEVYPVNKRRILGGFHDSAENAVADTARRQSAGECIDGVPEEAALMGDRVTIGIVRQCHQSAQKAVIPVKSMIHVRGFCQPNPSLVCVQTGAVSEADGVSPPYDTLLVRCLCCPRGVPLALAG